MFFQCRTFCEKLNPDQVRNDESMPRPNPLTPEVQAVFLAALRGGTLVVAAAASVGVAVQTLYRRRGRDPRFDCEWTAAAEASFLWAWRWRRKRHGGRGWVRSPTKRRLRFAGDRQAAYLEALGRVGDCNRAALAAGVDPRTVRRALRSDPDFARENEAALERGRVRRARSAALERARSAGRMIRIVERNAAAMADPKSGHDRHIRRLKRRWRPDRANAWRGPGFVRTPAEAIPELKRKIRRIELDGWKRSRGRGLPLEAGDSALRAPRVELESSSRT